MNNDVATLNVATYNKLVREKAKIEQHAFVELLRTHHVLGHQLTTLLKTEGLSEPQFNVLRILRGAGAEGLPCGEIAERMITPSPDISRLLDRLAALELVERSPSAHDRRVVVVRLTKRSERILGKLDRPVAELHCRQLGHLTRPELKTLIALLSKARTPKERTS